MNEEQKAIMLANIAIEVTENPAFGLEIMALITDGLKEYKHKIDKRSANIWLVVKNLKPEYLEVLKKIIIPEVFEDLNLN